MNQQPPGVFLSSVYLGDRACKSIHIDGWKSEVHVEVDRISRIRSSSGHWDFYSDEDIVDGRLVFTGVRSIRFDPSGAIPNDLIHEIGVRSAASPSDVGVWVFHMSMGSVAADGTTTEVLLEIIATDVHLEDPARAGAKIRD